MWQRVLLVLLTVACGALAAPNVCRDTARCCQMFDFQRSSALVAFTNDTVALGTPGPWQLQGLEISSNSNTVGLVNVSRSRPVAMGADHTHSLAESLVLADVVGADHIHSPAESLVLAAFEHYPDELLRYSSTIDLTLAHQPACLASIRTLRSIMFNYRQSVRVTTYQRDNDDLTQVEQQAAPWSVWDRYLQNEWEFTSSRVDVARVEFYGSGYGAVARVEVCYADPQGVDACGLCGGLGAECAAPVPRS